MRGGASNLKLTRNRTIEQRSLSAGFTPLEKDGLGVIFSKAFSSRGGRNENYFLTGFTLIELLLAMVIMAIIAGIGATNYLTSLKRGNDGKRAADLNTLRNALEMYYLDQSPPGYPPSTGGDWMKVEDVLGTGVLVASYTQVLPSDPKSGRFYLYKSDGNCYCLSAKMEIEGNKRTSIGTYCTSCPGALAPEDHSGKCYLVTCP